MFFKVNFRGGEFFNSLLKGFDNLPPFRIHVFSSRTRTVPFLGRLRIRVDSHVFRFYYLESVRRHAGIHHLQDSNFNFTKP